MDTWTIIWFVIGFLILIFIGIMGYKIDKLMSTPKPYEYGNKIGGDDQFIQGHVPQKRISEISTKTIASVN